MRPLFASLATFPFSVTDAAVVDRGAIAQMIVRLQLGAEAASILLEKSELVAAWWRLPEQYRELGLDLPSVRERMGEIARDAMTLSYKLDSLGPRFAAAIHYVYLVEPEAEMLPDRRHPGVLLDAVNDLAVVAERIFTDLPRGRRPREYTRDNALRLAVAAVEEATGERVAISRGPRDSGTPHFSNPAGHFVRDFFILLGVAAAKECQLVRAWDRIRRK